MTKEIIKKEEARKKLFAGAKKVADILACTLGPAGRNVVLEKKFGTPQVIRDGVSIAKEITDLECAFESLGAKLIQEASVKTNDLAGDGTTTASVLTGAILDAGMRHLAASANPVILNQGMKEASESIITELANISRKIESNKDIEQVATISAANDSEVGQMIAEAMEKVGKDGVISLEESKSINTELEVVEGMQFDKGYISPYFCTDQERMEAVLEEPFVLIANNKINIAVDLIPLLESVSRAGKPLLIVAEDVEGEALAALVVNTIRSVIKCAAVKAPGFGDRRKAMLEDIAILTGGTVVSDDVDLKLKDINIEMLGKARRVVVNANNTTVVAFDSTKDNVEARIKQIENQIAASDSEYDKEKLNERKAKLSGGVAVLKVGAPTEAELKDKKLRLEDALNATRAAVEMGIVPGGGTTLAKASKSLESKLSNFEGEKRLGAEIIVAALRKLVRQIADNAGFSGEVVLEKVMNDADANVGFNAAIGEYVNMFDAGIVDPVKVTISALRNSVSIAGQIMLTDAAVIESKSDEAAHAHAAPNPGMMGGF